MSEKPMFGQRDIRFLAVVPLHRDEMQLELDKGMDALLDRLDAAGITEILHQDRPSARGLQGTSSSTATSSGTRTRE